MMKITIPYGFTAQVIPYRCRKSRPEYRNGAITLTVNEVTGGEAPIAIRQFGDGYLSKRIYEFRWWRGKLWARKRFQRASCGKYETQTAAQFQHDPYPYKIAPRCSTDFGERYQDRDRRRRSLMAWARSILFIDGKRYEVADEPRYVIHTFGLGGNHGLGWGTSPSVEYGYNSNIGRGRYFRIDQYDAMVAEATRIATARGDTKALPIERQRPTKFEILIPEAVRLNPAKEHGTGCSFINRVERMIENVRDPKIASIGMLALLTAP